MQKTLDVKLARIAADPSSSDFILADAKDADMALGLSAPGLRRGAPGDATPYRSLQEYRDAMREIVREQLVDIMLMSMSSNNVLTLQERLFDDSPVTPAIRANDSTDIWLAGSRNAYYASQPSLPFRSARLEEAAGEIDIHDGKLRQSSATLGLYSITLNNDAALDRATLEAYRDFRQEAARRGFRHFLEVFAPNACPDLKPEDVPRFVNDSVARVLAGIGAKSRPLFLKMPYFGPAALEQLVCYDSSLVVGILGGSAGTTFDAFAMLVEAKTHGARAALFGRKINSAEHQTTFVRHLRLLADGEIEPAEAVRAYHAELKKLKIAPLRTLEQDLERTAASLSYASN